MHRKPCSCIHSINGGTQYIQPLGSSSFTAGKQFCSSCNSVSSHVVSLVLQHFFVFIKTTNIKTAKSRTVPLSKMTSPYKNGHQHGDVAGHTLYLCPLLCPADTRSQLDGRQGLLKVCQGICNLSDHCEVAITMAQGLSKEHSQLTTPVYSQSKCPDITSRNVLVISDRT